MKMKEIIPVTEHRIWKTDYLNSKVSTVEKRRNYCREQTRLGRKDSYNIYEEARRKYR